METGLTKNRIISELSKSPHGKLEEYLTIGQQATEQDPEFFAHLIAWDFIHGQVKDAKVALPVISMTSKNFPPELLENSLAHMAKLGPREIERAYHFALSLRDQKLLTGKFMSIRRMMKQYLIEVERIWPKFDRMSLQHRKTLANLYALTHTKPIRPDKAGPILFSSTQQEGKRIKTQLPDESLAAVVAKLHTLPAEEAASLIVTHKIPFLVAMGALGKKLKEPDLLLALINQMTPNELITNTKNLNKWGMQSNSALRGAYEKKLEEASKSKSNILKTTRAAESVDDEVLREKLRGVQERQFQSKSIEGNWLVLGDKSGSMTQAIDLAKEVAAVLAKMVKDKVWLVFFDTQPQSIDVTGQPLDVIKNVTRYIRAQGGTSIGCGLKRMLDAKVEVDGIAIVSDGGENNPPIFSEVLKQYNQQFSKDVPVYLYHCAGDQPTLISSMKTAGLDMQVFDMRQGNIDYYSLPNLVTTMRTNRYSLVDEVMATRLLKLSDVFKKIEQPIIAVGA